MRLVYGSRTSNCRNLLNIGPNDLNFLLKDRQLNLHEKIKFLNFVYDKLFPRYLLLKLPLLHIVLNCDKFGREILSKIKPTATLLQFVDEVLRTELMKKVV